MRVDFRSDADLIAVFMSTPDALRAYEIAAKFRKQGKTVVFGGLHASFMPDEVLEYGDAVLIGEVEGIWETLLEDFGSGRIQQKYQRSEPVDLATLNPFPTNIIKKSRYGGFWSVIVGRGCTNWCSYCAVCPFFKTMRFRPVEDIVKEICDSGAQLVELHADNLTADRDYALNLFKALEPLKIQWAGETTLDLADDPELLQAAARSGLRFLLVGLETPSRAALDKAGKGFVDVGSVKKQIDIFHDHGIIVDSAFLFGFDEHDKNIFHETNEFAKEIGLDSIHAVIVIPFPGTKMYKTLDKEGRILTKDWSQYDGAHVVFEPKRMTRDELSEGTWWFYKQTLKMKKNYVGTGTYPGFDGSVFYGLSHIKWKTLLGLVFLAAAVVTNWNWMWGVFFLLWSCDALFTGHVHLVEPISREENPVLFWIITVAWVGLSIASFVPDSWWHSTF